MRIPENLDKLTTCQTFNDKDEILEIEDSKNCFGNLRMLVLIQMGLSWKQLKVLSVLFPNVEELLLCYNKCSDFEEITDGMFPKLKSLNLEKNEIVYKDIDLDSPVITLLAKKLGKSRGTRKKSSIRKIGNFPKSRRSQNSLQ